MINVVILNVVALRNEYRIMGSTATLSVTSRNIEFVAQNIVILGVNFPYSAECCYAECHYAVSRGAQKIV
jgi:hypothetical protein